MYNESLSDMRFKYKHRLNDAYTLDELIKAIENKKVRLEYTSKPDGYGNYKINIDKGMTPFGYANCAFLKLKNTYTGEIEDYFILLSKFNYDELKKDFNILITSQSAHNIYKIYKEDKGWLSYDFEYTNSTESKLLEDKMIKCIYYNYRKLEYAQYKADIKSYIFSYYGHLGNFEKEDKNVKTSNDDKKQNKNVL